MPDVNADQATTGGLSVVRGKPLDESVDEHLLTIAGFFDDLADRWGEREALVAYTDAGVERWSYADLRDRARAIARALAANGVAKGSRVGVLMTNRPEFLASVYGIALAGGVVVAFNTFVTPSELDNLLQAADIEVLLFERRVAKRDFAGMLTELEPGVQETAPGKRVSHRFPFLRLTVSLGEDDPREAAGILHWEEFLRHGEPIPDAVIRARAAALSPADTAILFFSSGTTGQPKGVVHNQRAVVLQWRGWPPAMGFTGALRVWTANGFFWSGNFAMAIGSALSTGGTLVLQPIFDASEALKLIVEERVNAPFAMPHQWGKIADTPGFRQADLSHLTFLDGRFYGLDNPSLPTGFQQSQAFGCTETLTIVTTTRVGEGEESRREGHGLPLPGNIIRIVDPMSGKILPRGQEGEIAVKGPTLMQGYLNKTADQCFDEDGFYHTGDGGYLDDNGWLFWEGRLTDIIKTGGVNVSPLEVDDVITTYPPVKATQTVGLPHHELGEIVVSCIVPHDRATFSLEAFHAFLKERLASYKLPREVLVLDEQELSLTGSGHKVKAADVRKLAAARLSTDKGDKSQ